MDAVEANSNNICLKKSLDRDRNYIHCLHYTMKGNYSFPFLLYFPELRRASGRPKRLGSTER